MTPDDARPWRAESDTPCLAVVSARLLVVRTRPCGVPSRSHGDA